MVAFLYLGIVLMFLAGAIGGWLLRGSHIARTRFDEEELVLMFNGEPAAVCFVRDLPRMRANDDGVIVQFGSDPCRVGLYLR